MRRLLFACLLLAPAAQAQVYECPKFYPAQDTVLAEVPYGHTGKGVVAKRALAGAAVMIDGFNMPGELHGGERRKVEGGVDVAYPASITWFVCYYGQGSAVAWWEQIKLDKHKARECVMQSRAGGRDPMDIKLVCK
jgi:hypothetical protein